MAKRKSAKKRQQEKELYTYLGVIVFVALMIIALMKLGLVGKFLYSLFAYVLGNYFYVIFIAIMIMLVITCNPKRRKAFSSYKIAATVLLLFALLLASAIGHSEEVKGFDLFNNYVANTSELFLGNMDYSGGLVGVFLISLSTLLFDWQGTYIVIGVLIIIALILLIPLPSYEEMAASFAQKKVEHAEKKALKAEEKEREALEKQYAKEEAERLKQEETMASKQQGVSVPQMIDVDDVEITKEVKSSTFIDIDDIQDGLDKDEVVETPVVSMMTDDVVKHVDDAKTKLEVKKSDQNVSVRTSGPYHIPPLTLLDPLSSSKKSSKNQISAKEKGERLIEILANFGIDAKLIATHIGPSVTKFEVKPDASVKVSKINSISDNIKMELAARDIRIEAPIPGKNAVGIEIPNVESTMVKMKELMVSIPKEKDNKPLLFVLGKDLTGKSVFCELDKMPHLLIAGQTGSGKSVCMNTIITSILLRCSCDDVKLLLIDPKKVEFTPYHKIPHLLGPVICDPNQASAALKIVVKIMEERYDTFASLGVRNIGVYNEKVKKDTGDNKLQPMPYIVVIIDELADLMAVAGKEVEVSIQRITQLARAAGIHLIVATQRPSTDVITGIIKANIPSRIAFNVSSSIDSRTIIDQTGAERLLGNGDMLYYPTGSSSPTRLQGVYVTDDEVKNICDYCASQRAPLYEDSFIRLEGVEGNDDTAVMQACDDPLYEEIKEYVIEAQKASASLIQRRFGVGFNRAARMIDILEEQGVIGPQQGSRPREVYMKKDQAQN